MAWLGIGRGASPMSIGWSIKLKLTHYSSRSFATTTDLLHQLAQISDQGFKRFQRIRLDVQPFDVAFRVKKLSRLRPIWL